MLSTPFFCCFQINGLVVLEFKMFKNLVCQWHFKVSAPLHYFLDGSYQPPMYSIWKAHQWHDYFFLDCKKQYKIPAWAMTSTVLVSNRSFCLGAFRAGRSNVGPKTIAKLCRDILFSLSLWWILKLWKKCFFFLEGILFMFSKRFKQKWPYFNKWSRMKHIEALHVVGISLNIICRALVSSFSLMLLNLLKVSMNLRYRVSVNRVSGSSRRNDLNIPVTEWMSTSLSNCSAS